MNLNPTSLKNRIRNANTSQEIDKLLAEGKTYQFASDNTRGKWRKTALIRLDELKHQTEKPKEKVPVEDTPVVDKPKRGRPKKVKENVNG